MRRLLAQVPAARREIIRLAKSGGRSGNERKLTDLNYFTRIGPYWTNRSQFVDEAC
jgi:hypothetical protein